MSQNVTLTMDDLLEMAIALTDDLPLSDRHAEYREGYMKALLDLMGAVKERFDARVVTTDRPGH